MAVVNTKGVNITNADAEPPVRNDPAFDRGRLRTIVDTVEVAAADDDGSVYRVARVWSGWSIHSITVFNDAITGGTAYDVGLYAAGDGAAVDDDAYASAADLSSASTVGAEVAFEARDVSKVRNKVWQDAGASADPFTWYDLCLTGDTVGTGAGTISVSVGFSVD